MNESFGVSWYEREDGRKEFGCRGIGTKYSEFYKWLNTTNHITTLEDWPWHYFVFENKEDENTLMEKFKEDVYYYKYEEEDEDES